MLAEEEKNTPGRSAPKNAKTATKKTRGIDQALGEADGSSLTTLNASGIDDAFDALGLATGTSKAKVDRRPEQRIAAAFEAWKEKTGREKELQNEGIRHSARQVRMWEEFNKSPDNPRNQVTAKYNATQEELRAMQAEEDDKLEKRLGSK